MKMNTTFSVIARCRKFITGENSKLDTKTDIELNFDLEKASRFLFRFYDNGFIIDDYKLLFKYKYGQSKVEMIALFKDEYTYIVLNEDQLINDVIKGYNNIIMINKLTDFMEFDFEAAADLSNVEDEFGE